MRADPILGQKYARTVQFSRIVFTVYALAYFLLALLQNGTGSAPEFAGRFPFLGTDPRWIAAAASLASVVLAALMWVSPKRLKLLFAVAMGLMAVFALTKFVSAGIGVFELLVLAVCQRGWAAARNEHYMAHRKRS